MRIWASLGQYAHPAAPQRLRDADGAAGLDVHEGAIQFDGLRFTYGRDTAASRSGNLSIKAGAKNWDCRGLWRVIRPVSLLLRLYPAEQGHF